jgi:hypothetical protein
LTGENVDQFVGAVLGEDKRCRSLERTAKAELNRDRHAVSDCLDLGLELVEPKNLDFGNAELNVRAQHLAEYAGGPTDPDIDQLAERVELLRCGFHETASALSPTSRAIVSISSSS